MANTGIGCQRLLIEECDETGSLPQRQAVPRLPERYCLTRYPVSAGSRQSLIDGVDCRQVFASIKGKAVAAPLPVDDRVVVCARQLARVAVPNGTLYSLVRVDGV